MYAVLNNHYCLLIFTQVNLLLPTTVFFEMIKKLLCSNSGTVRRKAMELLNSKLGHHTGTYPDDQVTFFFFELLVDLDQILPWNLFWY